MNLLLKFPSLICDELFFRSWWVIFFILFCFLCYEQGLKKNTSDFERLHTQFVELHKEYRHVVTIQEKLQGEKNSFDDPAWIERVLMEELGLVPSGQTKIFFSDH